MMTGFTVRTGSDRWTLGYEGENNSRTLQIKTTDDLTDFATVNLLIDTLDCGAMTIQTVSNYRILEMVITEEMLGLPGLKTCQLVMKNTAGSVVLKTNQFYMYVKSSNVTDRIYISTEDTIKAALTALINDGVLEDLSIEDGSITTAKIANGAITQAKLDPNISFEADDELDATSTNAVQNKVVAQAISALNESLDVYSELKKPISYTLNPGYISTSGTIGAQNAIKKEVYTSFIPISEGEAITFEASWPTTSESKWLVYAMYDANKEFISRGSVVENGSEMSYEKTFKQSGDVAFIIICYRTYGEGVLSVYTEWTELENKFSEVADEFSGKITDISQNTKIENYVDGYIMTHQATIDVNDVKKSSGCKCIVVPCTEGDIFSIKGKSGTSTIYMLWAFVDSEGNRLDKSGIVHYTEYTVIKAPINAAYLVSNAIPTDPYGLYRGRLLASRVSNLEAAIGTITPTGLNNPLLRPCSPRVAMHRGFNTQAPENTLPAFELAGQAGAWAIEMDIFETTDGYFVISHDNDVSRMTDGTGNITAMTYAETQEFTIDAGSNIEQYPNLKMPTLQEYLSICRRYGCVAFVEIKTITHYDALVAEIRKAGMEGSTVFLIHYTLAKVNALRAETGIPIAMLGDLSTNLTEFIDIAADNVDLWVDLYAPTVTAEVIEYAHSKNVPVAGWTYGAAGANNAIRLGLDIVTADGFAKLPTT